MLERKWLTMDKEPVADVAKEVDKLLREGERVIHIGTDAQKADRKVEFVTCIVVLKPTKGGRVFYTRVKKTKRDIQSLRQKLFTEAWMSIEAAMELNELIPDETKVVVHLDVNPNERWASSRHINEIVGMVVGQGFEVLTKPDAWCASHCADHMVKNKNDKHKLMAVREKARARRGK